MSECSKEENYEILYDEDEDVVLEGSDLHKTLTNMGYTNFNYEPKLKNNCEKQDNPINKILYASCNDFIQNLKDCYYYLTKDNSFNKNILQIILGGNILLDDHAMITHDLNMQIKNPLYIKIIKWFPYLSSSLITIFNTVLMKKPNNYNTIFTSTLFSILVYKKFTQWSIKRNLRNLIFLQNNIHNMCKQILRIIRRTCNKTLQTDIIEKNYDSLGSAKQNIVFSLKILIIELFKKLSYIYYNEANEILQILPNFAKASCVLTNIYIEPEFENYQNKDELRTLYFTYILIQSEAMLIFAHAFSGKINHNSFSPPYKELEEKIKKLICTLLEYNEKVSNLFQAYQVTECQPINRVMKKFQNSKYQDAYIHLNLTSHRLQTAFTEIISILDAIDLNSDEDNTENNFLSHFINDKVNEVYKQIETAKNFAEFSSLLIAKAQRKCNKNIDDEKDENLFKNDNSENEKIVIFDKDLEIEDEVFEEYIKEEYLKPLTEECSSEIIQNIHLDKILKKNFMSELKEALIEKQKSMTERELKALKRMYNKVKDSQDFKTESSTHKKEDLILTPKLPPPPSPPPFLMEQIINDDSEVHDVEKKKKRTPVPLPRVKMFKVNEENIDSPRFSIKDYQITSNIQFAPGFRISEETFLGSGENSEEEIDNNDECDN